MSTDTPHTRASIQDLARLIREAIAELDRMRMAHRHCLSADVKKVDHNVVVEAQRAVDMLEAISGLVFSETSTPASSGDAAKALRAVMLFPNFNIAAFDRDGKQTDAQCNLLVQWAEFAARAGYDPTSTVIETPTGKWSIYKTTEGTYNLESA